MEDDVTAAGRPPLQCASPIETWTGVTAAVVRCAVRGEIVAFPPPPPWKPCSPAAGLVRVAAKKGRVGDPKWDKEQNEMKKKWFTCGTFSHSLSGSKKKNFGGDNRASSVVACGKDF